MQKIATKIFTWTSVFFGIIGILVVITLDPHQNGPNVILMKLLFISAFIILTSFALSVASKYLGNKS